ncbi:MAG: response regulator transcription factor [Caldilineaceae bacterium]|nr:response regulator transcription factor [Caldilineaceae bacterium]MCB9149899.1 response regulator transcription factor [Caldilineaceae bacterium]
MSYTVFIIEDNKAIRSAYHQVLSREADMYIGGEAATAAEGLAKLSEIDVDVILVDLALPDQSGLELLIRIKQEYPTKPVLIVSGQPEYVYKPRVLKLGASGYIDKVKVVGVLADAIRMVTSGYIYTAPDIPYNVNNY